MTTTGTRRDPDLLRCSSSKSACPFSAPVCGLKRGFGRLGRWTSLATKWPLFRTENGGSTDLSSAKCRTQYLNGNSLITLMSATVKAGEECLHPEGLRRWRGRAWPFVLSRRIADFLCTADSRQHRHQNALVSSHTLWGALGIRHPGGINARCLRIQSPAPGKRKCSVCSPRCCVAVPDAGCSGPIS